MNRKYTITKCCRKCLAQGMRTLVSMHKYLAQGIYEHCLHRSYSNQEYYNKNALLDAGNARKYNQTFPHVLLYLEYFLNNIIATEEGIRSNMLMG